MEHGGLDLMVKTETIHMEACCNNWWGYGVMCAVVHPFRAVREQSNVGLGSRERPNGWGSESTRFHMSNMVICEILWKVPDVESV